MKKIILLGGSHGQLPAILEAKKRGYYTILCDYLEDNPGKMFADLFLQESTTDKERILQIAIREQADFIFSYASDPAALTASYVSEKLNLPGNCFASTELLVKKDLFREFLFINGFNTPYFEVIEQSVAGSEYHTKLQYPVVVKPVDSSDTKGVTLVKKPGLLIEALDEAFQHSKSKKAIIEEFIDAEIANFHGDGFVLDGELVFCALGDLLYTSVSHPIKPSCTQYPSKKSEEIIQYARHEINRLIKLTGFNTSAVNIEARYNSQGTFYIMEIGPRSGGSYTPEAVFHATGVNMLKQTFDWFEGKKPDLNSKWERTSVCFTLHSNQDGRFDRVEFDTALAEHIKELHLYINTGDILKRYSETGSAVGACVFVFNNDETAKKVLSCNFYDRVLDGIKCIQEYS